MFPTGILYDILLSYQFFSHSVFFQVQSVFGHLMDSKLQYFAPEQFWKYFKLWGQPVNVREQQVNKRCASKKYWLFVARCGQRKHIKNKVEHPINMTITLLSPLSF